MVHLSLDFSRSTATSRLGPIQANVDDVCDVF
jgi:hypothetical protein